MKEDEASTCVHAQSLSHVRLFVTPWTVAHQAPLSLGFPRQEWSGLHFPLQGIFLTHELNPCLLYCRQILYHWAAWEAQRVHTFHQKYGVIILVWLEYRHNALADYIEKTSSHSPVGHTQRLNINSLELALRLMEGLWVLWHEGINRIALKNATIWK